jgi:hypothetical protein
MIASLALFGGGASVLASGLGPSAPFFNTHPAIILYGRAGAAAPPQFQSPQRDAGPHFSNEDQSKLQSPTFQIHYFAMF